MKKLLFLLLANTVISCTSLQQLISDCNQTPSTLHLETIRNVNFNAIGDVHLANSSNRIDYCFEHFKRSTPAGMAFGRALSAVNDVEGSLVHFTNGRSNHKIGGALVPSNPTVNIFGYMSSNDIQPSSCADDYDFALQFCPHDVSSAGVEHFTIMVNGDIYEHFNDTSSDDYPNDRGVLHELAHAVGMHHVRFDDRSLRWSTNDAKYISSMQGGQRFLTALDVAYLRNFYPTGMPEHRNYVAGTKTRFANKSGWFDTKSFYDQNPESLYIDEHNNIKDCATNNAPIFSVSWFNTGNIDSEPTLCGMNRIYLRTVNDRYSTRGVTLKQWKIAPMPHLSQDQWEGNVSINSTDITRLNFSADYELVFHVNSTGIYDEISDDDNVVSYPISIYENPGGCRTTRNQDRRRRSKINKDGITH